VRGVVFRLCTRILRTGTESCQRGLPDLREKIPRNLQERLPQGREINLQSSRARTFAESISRARYRLSYRRKANPPCEKCSGYAHSFLISLLQNRRFSLHRSLRASADADRYSQEDPRYPIKPIEIRSSTRLSRTDFRFTYRN